MMKMEDRDKLDNLDDQSGFKLAAGGLAVLFPRVPGERIDRLSFIAEPSVRCVGALVGESVELRLTTRAYNTRWELLRRPDGSKAQFATHTVTLDKAGVYLARIWIGAWLRDVAIAAWPLAELNRLGNAPLPGKPDPHYFERRERLQGIASDPRVSAATLVASLETNASGCWGFDGTIFGAPGLAPVNTSW